MVAEQQEPGYDDLQRRLEEAEETLRAIRNGEVDALIVSSDDGERVFTLQGADHPYRELIESMQQGAATLNVDGTILYCNGRFAQMVGRPLERVIGARVTEFLPAMHRLPFHRLMNRASGRGEFPFAVPDGTLLPVYVALSSLPLNGEIALCMVVTDLTDQKEHQDLQEVNRRKDEFLAMLAHELRNPLAPIRNALYLLKRSEVDRSSAEEIRSMMEHQVEHLARLIDDLMDVSRISTGKVELRIERVELASVVSRATELSRALMNEKKHDLTVHLPQEPTYLWADPTRLEQILDNLLTNSAKYTDSGGQIRLSAQLDGEEILIRLSDNGIGIAPEKIPRIFDLFVQVERRLDRSQGGLGLGLSLVKSLVELHGGTVKATSPGLGHGTEFEIRLPAIARVEPSKEDGVSLPRGVEPPVKLRRFLVVDDNIDSARSMAMVIERLWKQMVEVAHDGPEALEKAIASQPDAILLDIGLPGMSGYEVARRLRLLPEFRDKLLIAMTGLGQEEDIERSRQSGFNHHLVKPIDLDELRNLVS